MKKSRKTLYILILIVVMSIIYTSCTNAGREKSNPQTSKPEEGAGTFATTPKDETSLVPDFTLKNTEGEDVSLSDYKGKIVVINFWASWCGPCKEEMPDFQKLSDEASDYVVLMLNQTHGRETKEKADSFLDKGEYNFINLYDEGSVGIEIFNVTAFPTTVVIDENGYITEGIMGMTTYENVAQMIERAR